MISISTFLVILFLVFTNGITDASNAVATVVGTKVISYRKACILSGILNAVGVLTMYQINPSVSSTISEIASLPYFETSMMIIMIASLVTILFSLISAFNGIPASESYGLIFGILGAIIATFGTTKIHIQKIFLIMLGIVFSLVGTHFISIIIKKFSHQMIQTMSIKQNRIMQVLSCFSMSFAHGAQDGLKFIGLLKLYQSMPNCFWIGEWKIVLLCASILAVRNHDRRQENNHYSRADTGQTRQFKCADFRNKYRFYTHFRKYIWSSLKHESCQNNCMC